MMVSLNPELFIATHIHPERARNKVGPHTLHSSAHPAREVPSPVVNIGPGTVIHSAESADTLPMPSSGENSPLISETGDSTSSPRTPRLVLRRIFQPIIRAARWIQSVFASNQQPR